MYTAGEVLVGQYRIDLTTGHAVRAVECSVIWTSSGIGDEDFGVHFFERRAKSTLVTGQLKKLHRISTVLPKSPLTYPGQLMQITWRFRVRVFTGLHQYFEDCQFRLGKVSLAEYQTLT